MSLCDFVLLNETPTTCISYAPLYSRATSLNNSIMQRSLITQAKPDPRLYAPALTSMTGVYANWLLTYNHVKDPNVRRVSCQKPC